MSVEATVDHPAVHSTTVGDKVGRCNGVVLKIDERNLAAVIQTNPSFEVCKYCTLQLYCDQSMGGISKED